MDRLETMGYENYRCRGPEFPLPCTESVANLAGAVENRTTEINKVEVWYLTLCVCVLCMHVYLV